MGLGRCCSTQGLKDSMELALEAEMMRAESEECRGSPLPDPKLSRLITFGFEYCSVLKNGIIATHIPTRLICAKETLGDDRCGAVDSEESCLHY